ncbi:hypothetical protein L198_05574 [Cryptococcus wingfieldii CBS 7118]|uniref:Uncharacterized protein n=1 Tax=Cryptococcus wingfieldii CBS 7118 TaxID=1295528 RepID=A0A1E3IW06_9TREE|nr:hypothetical protein L198_05574 [Cryptococcus wingfieldii CBS 7118]ODN92779.1 hypothetical protein L198_05574 [Cryptococcus wingfieldii CBS 7118]
MTSQNATLSASVPTAIVEEVSEGRPESDKPTKRQRAVDEGLQASDRAPISIQFGTSSAPAPRPSLRPTAAYFKPTESKGIVFGAALAREAEERSSKASRASTASSSSSKKLRAAASEFVPPSRSFASESANFTFAMPFATTALWSQGGLIDTPSGTSIGDAPACNRLNFVSSSAVPFKPASLRKVSLTSIPSSSAPGRVDSPAESVATTTASEAKIRASAPIFTPGAKSSTNSSPAFAPSRVPSTTPLSTATKIRAAAAVFMPASSIGSGSLPSSPVKGSSRTPSISSTTSKTVLKHDAPAFIPSLEKRKRARAEDYLHKEPAEKTSSEMEVDTAPRENTSASTESGIQTVQAGDDGKVGSQVVIPVPAEDPAPANEGQTTDQEQGHSSSSISAPSSAFDITTTAPSETAEASLREMDGSHNDGGVKRVIEQADGNAEAGILSVEQSVIHFRREASPMSSADRSRPDSLGNSELSEVPSLSEDGRTPRPSLATRHSYNSYRPRDTPDISSSLSEPTVPLDDVVIHPSQPLPSHHTAQIYEKSPSITMLSAYAFDEDDSTEPFATAIEAGTEDGEGVEREMESIATPDVPYTASTLNAHYAESEEEASGSGSGTVREAEFAEGVEQSILFGSQKVGGTPGGSNFEFTFGELSRSSPSSLEQIEEQHRPQDSLQPTLLAPAANAGPARSLRSSAPSTEVSSSALLSAAPSPHVPMVAHDSEEAADFKRSMEYSKMSESPRAAFPDNIPDLLSVEATGRAIGVDSDLNTPATRSYEASGVLKMLEDLRQQYGRKVHISPSPGGIREEILHSVPDLTAQQSEWSSYLIEKLTSALEDQTQLLTTLKQNMSAPPVSPSAYSSTQDEDTKGNTRQEDMFTAILTSQHAILSKFDEVAAIRLSCTDDLHTAIAALHEAEDAAKDRSSSAHVNAESEVRVTTLSTELASTKSQVTSLEAEVGILKQRLKDTRYERNELRDTMDAKEKQLLGAIMSEEKKNEEMDRLVARALAAELERDAFAKKVKEMRLDELEDEKELKQLQLEVDKDEALAELHSTLKESQQALASTQSQLTIALQALHPAPTLNPPEPSPLLVSTSSALAELSQSSYSFHEEIISRISKLDDDMHESMGSRVKEYGEALGENRRLTGEVDTLRQKLESASRERLNLEKDVLPKFSALETEHIHTVVSLQSETARREAAESKLAEMEKRLSVMQEQTMRWQIEVATRHSQAQMGEIRLQTLTQENAYWREFALGADRRRFRSYVASRPFAPDQSVFHTPATEFKSAARSTARIVSSPLTAVTPTRGGDQRNTSPLKRSIKGSTLDSPIVVSDESMDMDIANDESREELLSP